MQSSHASTCVFKLVAPTVRSTSLRPSVRPSVPPSVEKCASHAYYPRTWTRVRGHTYTRGKRRRGRWRRKGVRGVHKPACIQIKLPEKLLISGPIATGPFISGPRASLSARNSLNIGRPLTCQKPPPRIPDSVDDLEIRGGSGGREKGEGVI